MAGRGGQGLDEYSQRELLAQLDRDQGQVRRLHIQRTSTHAACYTSSYHATSKLPWLLSRC